MVVIAVAALRKKKSRYRLMALEGDSGCVFCRIHSPESQGTLPRLSENRVVECATRSLLRMFNIIAVRKQIRNASMVGPADYFCNVEEPDKYCFTIELPTADMPVHAQFPKWVHHPLESQVTRTPHNAKLRPVIAGVDSVLVNAVWVSGVKHPNEVANRMREYTETHRVKTVFGDSLFKFPGMLEVSDLSDPDKTVFEFPPVDATELDTSDFKCRLVRNDQPFWLNNDGVRSDAKDYPRPVTYDFGPDYASHCVYGENSGGLFLEHHWGFR
eukprot:GHVN01011240.1.p1 GENE.GHVN01011240.1~~GHVN01011240.1.p1  ORF type:complete len:290 (+),score=16.56 GHVN01011240.1:58-870(+)